MGEKLYRRASHSGIEYRYRIIYQDDISVIIEEVSSKNRYLRSKINFEERYEEAPSPPRSAPTRYANVYDSRVHEGEIHISTISFPTREACLKDRSPDTEYVGIAEINFTEGETNG